MRVIKDNTLRYQSFLETLEQERAFHQGDDLHFMNAGEIKNNRNNLIEKYSHFFQIIILFEKELKSASDIPDVVETFNNILKRIITLKDAVIFFYNEKQTALVPVGKPADQRLNEFLNSAHNKGALNPLFDSKLPVIIPDAVKSSDPSIMLNHLLIPVLDGSKKKGILSIITPNAGITPESAENQAIQTLLGIALSKLEVIEHKKEVSRTYHELQVYQSKLSNDYRLSAIGELTTGVVEDIISPLQVIMSYTDFLANEYEMIDHRIIKTIKDQVKKVDAVVNRLVKFASLNNEKFKIQPCNLNEIINEYYQVSISSLKYNNYEFILELENHIPPILSNPNFINQLLTNIFSLIMANPKNGGGILIQTKSGKEGISVRIVTTDFIEVFKSKVPKDAKDLGLRIIDNIVSKHEGKIKLEAEVSAGSAITLTFPIRRNFKK